MDSGQQGSSRVCTNWCPGVYVKMKKDSFVCVQVSCMMLF